MTATDEDLLIAQQDLDARNGAYDLDQAPEPEPDLPPPTPIRRGQALTQNAMYDLEAEEALLGAAMLSTKAADILAGIDPQAFGDPAHTHIAHAITTLHADGQPCDPVTVGHELRRHELLDLAGGKAALAHLYADVPSTTGAARYGSIVTSLAQLRRLQVLGGEITAVASTPGAEPASAAQAAQGLLDEVHDATAGQASRLVRIGDIMDGYVEHLDHLAEQPLTGITTGLGDLDKAIGGLQDGRLYVIAGRPGMGKSDVAAHLAREAALAERTTLIVSIEMSTNEVLDRLLARTGRLVASNLTHGRISPNDWPVIGQAAIALGQLPLWIDDNPAATIASIRADVRRTGAQLVVVDYLQLIGTAQAESRQIEVTALARALKRMARDLDVPVVALAQLNRALEQRFDKHPQLGDLRESGAIENEADVVIGLYRDDRYNRDSDQKGVMELVLMKNRTGPETTVKVAYLADIKMIANLAGANP